MAGDRAHWNAIFEKKKDAELGWFEKELSQSLKFIDQMAFSPESKVFLPGAGTSQLVDSLLEYGCQLVLNDISDMALTQLKTRVGTASCEYLHHNMALPLAKCFEVDAWIDRAVLHFLLTDEEIIGYFNNLLSVVKLGGYVLLAEFAPEGAEKCAGLEIHPYSITDMQRRLGSDFELLESEFYTFINPSGSPKPYTYGLFRRTHVSA